MKCSFYAYVDHVGQSIEEYTTCHQIKLLPETYWYLSTISQFNLSYERRSTVGTDESCSDSALTCADLAKAHTELCVVNSFHCKVYGIVIGSLFSVHSKHLCEITA